MYRTDGKLFNLRRLQAKPKVHVDIARDLLFSDDCTFYAATKYDMQESTNLVSNTCNDVGLTISSKKTEFMTQQLTTCNFLYIDNLFILVVNSHDLPTSMMRYLIE